MKLLTLPLKGVLVSVGHVEDVHQTLVSYKAKKIRKSGFHIR